MLLIGTGKTFGWSLGPCYILTVSEGGSPEHDSVLPGNVAQCVKSPLTRSVCACVCVCVYVCVLIFPSTPVETVRPRT